jgi:predicted DNA-binding protein (MmcQ/YjbR family)
VYKGGELEKELAAYALELGGVEEVIKNPKNEHKELRLFRRVNVAEAGEAASSGSVAEKGRIFLILHAGTDPLVVDFFVHPEIQKKLIEDYDTASASTLLDKKRAVGLVLTDQFELDDLKSFIFQSHNESN